ncbi:MAG: alpha-L-fucosidase [Verrucomicrobia bacterium]|nr:alpha-L-fucosidase [Verrucomicrobiota bacterium]
MKTMKTSHLLVSLLIALTAASAFGNQPKSESLEAYNARMAWYVDSPYGMFIHFGLYSQLGGEWQGEPAPWCSLLPRMDNSACNASSTTKTSICPCCGWIKGSIPV